MSRFICEVCDFSAPTRSRYYKHLSTQKHINNASKSDSDTEANLNNESSPGEIDAGNNDAPSSDILANHEDSLQNIVVVSPESNSFAEANCSNSDRDDDTDDAADDADDEFNSDSDDNTSDGYSPNDITPSDVYFTLHELLEKNIKNINQYNLYLEYVTSVHQNMLIILPVLTAIFGFYIGRHW